MEIFFLFLARKHLFKNSDPDRQHEAFRPGASVRVIVRESGQVKGAVSGARAVLRVTNLLADIQWWSEPEVEAEPPQIIVFYKFSINGFFSYFFFIFYVKTRFLRRKKLQCYERSRINILLMRC